MALNLQALLAIARRDITSKTGVTGVAGVADVACYASKSPELRQLRPLRVKNTELRQDAFRGVASSVAAALTRPPFDPAALQADADKRNRAASEARLTDRWCACGTMATLAVGGFRKSSGNREGVARWLCQECFDADSDAAG